MRNTGYQNPENAPGPGGCRCWARVGGAGPDTGLAGAPDLCLEFPQSLRVAGEGGTFVERDLHGGSASHDPELIELGFVHRMFDLRDVDGPNFSRRDRSSAPWQSSRQRMRFGTGQSSGQPSRRAAFGAVAGSSIRRTREPVPLTPEQARRAVSHQAYQPAARLRSGYVSRSATFHNWPPLRPTGLTPGAARNCARTRKRETWFNAETSKLK